MSISSTYYLNAPTLGSATAVFLNNSLSICAPDGWYSDGVISRQQVGCSLLPEQPCDCSIVCGFEGSTITAKGVYNYSVNAGSTTGAIVIRVSNISYPLGIIASFNGIDYNYVNAYGYGYLSGSVINEPSYFGQDSLDCGITGGTFTLDNYIFDGSVFNALGTQTVSISGAQLDLVGTSGLDVYIVIPKTVFGDQVVTLKLISPCDEVINVSAFISCPEELPTINASAPETTSEGICLLPSTSTYYIYYTGPLSPVIGQPALWAFLFNDINGQSPAPDGWYHSSGVGFDMYFHVLNGIIVQINDCGETP